MRSRELAKLLEKPDVELLLQKDAEGNGYSSCSGVDFDIIALSDNNYTFDVYTDDEEVYEFLEEDEIKDARNKYAVIFPC